MSAVRTLAAGQSCRIRVHDLTTGATTTIHENSVRLYEAPNWTADDRLIVNGDGTLWSIDVAGGEPIAVPLQGVPDLNNDHVLGRDGQHIYVSANDWQIYRASFADQTTQLLTTTPGGYFLHGISPDGSTLAYIAIQFDSSGAWTGPHIRTIRADGSEDRAVTSNDNVDDGAEYSPDGEWIYFNTERFARAEGHAQIARIRSDGSGLEQLTFDERVNWFPHASSVPGRFAYLSYPPGTKGHPADLDVEVRVVEDHAWDRATVAVSTFGGQGTINVNSWAPTGDRFAFVDYPR